MPSIRQAVAVPPARTIVVRSAGAVPPPGSVPTSGAPNASGSAGKIAFRANVLVAGYVPDLARGSFPQRLSETLREADTLGSSTQASPADIGISMVRVTNADELASIGRSFPNRTGAWISVDGAFTASAGWQLANLNRAIARALSNSITFPRLNAAVPDPGASDPRLPARDPNSNGTAGRPLLDAFERPGACTGARDFTKVYAAACTRWAPIAQNALPGSTPASTPASTTQGRLTPIAQSASEPALCSFPAVSRFWLRPTRTFERTGPELPAGTRVDLMAVTSATQGTLRLYDVRVAATQTVAAARPFVGQRGWAAMSAADVASCASVIAARDTEKRTGGTVPKPDGTPGASTGGSNTAIVPAQPAQPATPAMRPDSTMREGQIVPPSAPVAPASSNTPYIVGGILVLTAGVIVWNRDAIRKMFK